MKSGLDAKPLFLQVDMLKDSMQRPSCFHIKFLITIQALYYVTFQCGSKNIFRKIKKEKNCSQKVEKTSQKSCILMAVRSFYSAAPTAQNSPELHFRFLNSSIQSSVLKSVWTDCTFDPKIQILKACPGVEWIQYRFQKNQKCYFQEYKKRTFLIQ